jgi:hypothetical protein
MNPYQASPKNAIDFQSSALSPRLSAVVQPATRAALKLAARYGLSLAHASTIAALAGLGADREAR